MEGPDKKRPTRREALAAGVGAFSFLYGGAQLFRKGETVEQKAEIEVTPEAQKRMEELGIALNGTFGLSIEAGARFEGAGEDAVENTSLAFNPPRTIHITVDEGPRAGIIVTVVDLAGEETHIRLYKTPDGAPRIRGRIEVPITYEYF